MLALLLGCAEPAATTATERRVRDFVGPAGLRVELAPAELPDEAPLHLVQAADAWELRLGERWDDAAPVATWPVEVGERLKVDGAVLLAPPLPSGAPFTTWYGEFPDAVRVEVADGARAGEWVFAAGVGPVVATVDGVRRECVYYEQGEVDTGE